MKSAEDWALEAGYSDHPNEKETWDAEVAHRRAIQLDAFKAGMTAAMQTHQKFPPSEHWEATQEMKKQIDEMTEVPNA